MINTSLSITQYLIERTLYEKLRLASVHYGYLPDITKYPKTRQGATDYTRAMEKISREKGFVLTIKNNIHSTEQGEKTAPRIVVETIQCIPGEFGQWGITQYQMTASGKYKKIGLPPQPVSYLIAIHLVSNSLEQARIMNSILARSVPRRGYHKITSDIYEGIPGIENIPIEELGPTFFCELQTSRVYPDPENNLKEDVHQYIIPDAWDITLVDDGEEISPINEIVTHISTHSNLGDSEIYFKVD